MFKNAFNKKVKKTTPNKHKVNTVTSKLLLKVIVYNKLHISFIACKIAYPQKNNKILFSLLMVLLLVGGV